MLTRVMISQIKEDILPGFSRTKILKYLDWAQNEIFGECAQTIFLNKSDDTFPLPILSTTDGTLNYVPSASNLVDSDGNAVSLTWNGYTVEITRIRRVFHQVTSKMVAYDKNKVFTGKDFIWSMVNPYYSYYTKTYQEEPGIPEGRSEAGGANFTFLQNPGTHTDKFYIEMYFAPPELTAESINMSIDTDKFAQAFFTACQGYAERSRNGRSDLLDGPARVGSFRKYWIPRMRGWLNKGSTQKRAYQFPTREAG